MKLLYDWIKYTLADTKLQREVKSRYYSDLSFFQIDRALLSAYIFRNPYRISKKYLKNRCEREVHTYGETPLITYEKIAEQVSLQRADTFLELGSGRGRGAFFLHHFFGCRVIGIERIPQFVKLSNHIAKTFQQQRASFICADMLKEELPLATIIYLYGTALADEEVACLIEKLKSYPVETKIISVSYPLTEYDKKSFYLTKTFTAHFPWGKTTAYIQKIIRSLPQ